MEGGSAPLRGSLAAPVPAAPVCCSDKYRYMYMYMYMYMYLSLSIYIYISIYLSIYLSLYIYVVLIYLNCLANELRHRRPDSTHMFRKKHTHNKTHTHNKKHTHNNKEHTHNKKVAHESTVSTAGASRARSFSVCPTSELFSLSEEVISD